MLLRSRQRGGCGGYESMLRNATATQSDTANVVLVLNMSSFVPVLCALFGLRGERLLGHQADERPREVSPGLQRVRPSASQRTQRH